MKFVRKITLSCVLVICFAGCLNLGIGGANYSKFDVDGVKFDADTHSVVVIGGGIGGLTSAIYLAQAGYKPVLIEGPMPGGNITYSPSVKNWPGDVDISGKSLAERIRNQAIINGVEILKQRVVAVDFSKWPYLVKTQELQKEGKIQEMEALSCIVALGASTNYLKVPGEKEHFGKGISQCAICDGIFYKNKVVAVVGGGNSAVLEASYLSNIAQRVLIFVRKGSLKASGKLKDEVIAKDNVEVIYNTNIRKIEGDGKKISSILVYDDKTNIEKTVKVDGIFLAIGSTPNSILFRDKLELDSLGYIKLKHYQETSKMGVFAVGDVADSIFKQAIIASGQGAKAAIQTGEFLESIGFDPKKIVKKVIVEEKKPEILRQASDFAKASPDKQDERKDLQIKEVEPKELKGLIAVESEKHFDEIIKNAKRPVVIDFYAGYCGPCRQMAPVFAKLAEDLKEKAVFLKVDVMAYSALTKRYDVKGIPTFVFLDSNGGEMERIVGMTDYEKLKHAVELLK